MKRIIIWAQGIDRPGIVAYTAQILLSNGYNLEDASMTILEGHFAMIIIASSKKIDPEAIQAAIRGNDPSLGLSVTVQEFEARPQHDSTENQKVLITLFGTDRPGLVLEVCKHLAENKINITDLSTKMTGDALDPLYSMLIEADLPSDMELEQAQKSIQELKENMRAEIGLTPIPTQIL